MSIQSEITRITTNVANALTEISNKGVTVPTGSTSDDLATLIRQITGGGSATLITKTITANGTYNASDDSADGYSSVTANIPNAFTITDVENTTGVTAQITGGVVPNQHTIHLEFTDSTDADISIYYNDSWVASLITSTEPTAYGQKTVSLAQLDNVTWYELGSIPLNTELIDFSKVTEDFAIDSNGDASSAQWYCASDYTSIAPGMTFTFTGCRWYYLAFYTSNKTFISSLQIDNITTPNPINSNAGDGTLSANIPANAAWIRISGCYQGTTPLLSLIRTA